MNYCRSVYGVSKKLFNWLFNKPSIFFTETLGLCCNRLNTRVAELESESLVFGWSWIRIPNNTGSQSQIFLSDSGCPIGSFFTSPAWIGNSCSNGSHSFETFVEIEISCCAPQFPLILTVKFHSLYVKELQSEILESRESGSGILESWSRKFWKVGVRYLSSKSATLLNTRWQICK